MDAGLGILYGIPRATWEARRTPSHNPGTSISKPHWSFKGMVSEISALIARIPRLGLGRVVSISLTYIFMFTPRPKISHPTPRAIQSPPSRTAVIKLVIA